MTRILLDPAAGDGGGVNPVPNPAEKPAAPAPAPAPAETPKVHLAPDEYRALLEARTRLAAVEDEKRRDAEAAEAKRLQALAEKGEAEKALSTLRESKDREVKEARDRADRIEAERLSDRKEAVIAQALLGAEFASDAAARDARYVLNDRFEAVRDAAGRIEVVDKSTRRPAAEVIKEWLAAPDSGHYRKASTTGGAGAQGGDRTTPTPGQGGAPQPRTLGELLIQQAIKGRGQGASGDGKPTVRIGGGLGFGL